MRRITGLILAAVLLLVVVPKADAQVAAAGASGLGGYGGYNAAGQPVGGFGFDYAQTIPSNSYVLDRWWMVTETPTVGTVPAPAAPPEAAPAAPAARRSRGRRISAGVPLLNRAPA